MYKILRNCHNFTAIHIRASSKSPKDLSFYKITSRLLSDKRIFNKKNEENRNEWFFNTWYKNVVEFKYKTSLFIFVGCASLIGFMELHIEAGKRKADNQALDALAEGTEEFGVYLQGLPEYTSDEIARHNSIEKKVWISFRHGVYDVTKFISEHPGGGENLMLGAGGSVEPFWALYAVHKSPHVLEMLEKYRIGNLKESEVGQHIKDMQDPYANEPRRHVVLIPSSKQPYNAEPPPILLTGNLLTPNEIFYVRNHLPVPEVDLKSYELDIAGLDLRESSLTLDDIKKFPKCTIAATVQCGGNRRSEMAKIKPIKGLSWGHAAISNAEWTGAKLYDVLKSAGLDENNTKALHVQFEGLDTGPTGNPYGASIPIEMAMDPKCDVLLAYEMNGQPIPRDHGFPLRLIVPGVIGARSIKWLGRIVVSEEESESHWQRNDYKGFAPNVDWDTVDFTKSPAIQEMPVNSAICEPIEGDKVKIKDGMVTVKGYAFSGGGRKIVRVDVSADGGKTWQAADELVADDSKHPRSWSWTIWTARIPVPEDSKDVQLVAKAIDSNYNTQPEKFENIWNLRGVISNAYHKVNVTV